METNEYLLDVLFVDGEARCFDLGEYFFNGSQGPAVFTEEGELLLPTACPSEEEIRSLDRSTIHHEDGVVDILGIILLENVEQEFEEENDGRRIVLFVMERICTSPSGGDCDSQVHSILQLPA